MTSTSTPRPVALTEGPSPVHEEGPEERWRHGEL